LVRRIIILDPRNPKENLMGIVVGLLIGLALLAVGGGGAVHLLVRMGKLEWVAPQDVVDDVNALGREDRKRNRPFSPPQAALVSSTTMSSYHRGYEVESHRIEMQRMWNRVEEWMGEVEGSKREAIRSLRDLHLFPLPLNLDEAPLGRAVYLLSRELRAARVMAWSAEDEKDSEFGPMSQQQPNTNPPQEIHQPVH
jgi:hypothetical protein